MPISHRHSLPASQNNYILVINIDFHCRHSFCADLGYRLYSWMVLSAVQIKAFSHKLQVTCHNTFSTKNYVYSTWHITVKCSHFAIGFEAGFSHCILLKQGKVIWKKKNTKKKNTSLALVWQRFYRWKLSETKIQHVIQHQVSSVKCKRPLHMIKIIHDCRLCWLNHQRVSDRFWSLTRVMEPA